MGLVLVQGADLGGRMVFLNGVGVGGKSAMLKESRHEHGSHIRGSQEPVEKEPTGHDHGAHAH